ncbi:MAG: hypothetical protein NTV51_24715 [Verrucomicrobia bacterium]|nr:hypothetical protein [Verrucomicrobiota bacterium]
MAEQVRDEFVGRSEVRAHLHVPVPQFAGRERGLFAGRGGGDAHRLGQLRVKALVQGADEIGGKRRAGLRNRPSLHLQMRQSKLLQVALLRLGGEVLFERSLDVPHTRLLALDQIGIVAVHPPRQLGDLTAQGLRQPGG